MYYSYVEIEYVATSFSPARTDLAVKLLNVICDELSNVVVQRYLSDATPAGRGIQLLPLENVAIVIKGEKLTTDAGQEV
jgi:hypothetical protein